MREKLKSLIDYIEKKKAKMTSQDRGKVMRENKVSCKMKGRVKERKKKNEKILCEIKNTH